MKEGHFHTIEIIAMSGLTAALAFHAFRFIGAKLATSGNAPTQRLGRGLLGVFTFGATA